MAQVRHRMRRIARGSRPTPRAHPAFALVFEQRRQRRQRRALRRYRAWLSAFLIPVAVRLLLGRQVGC
ncbi:hypothetical protein [Streptomyces sp. NPDC015414]|uniref:hypothetical protein n=1 Tax=Streptomyces sp. NPDC015414 TaxID=3364957 RepID=UPI0036FD0839